MREFVNPANAVTSGSLAAGVVALMLAGHGHLSWALAAVGLAALLDSVDGWVARRTGACGPFGCHLDSLADLVAFGAAPALMLERGVPGLGAGVGIVFVLAGAWRLARFQLGEDREHFVGLPIPPAGLIAAAITVIAPPAGLAVVLCLLLALLMVGEFTVPTLAELERLARRRPPPVLVSDYRDSEGAPTDDERASA